MMSSSLTSNYSDEDDGPLNDINVTPLVDVTLVLLIVFMITVPAIVGSAPVRVDLPETTAVAAASEQLPLVFTLKRGESGTPVLYLNENQTDEARLRKLFKDRGAPNEDERVSLSADQGISYGEVIRVIDLLESLGLRKLSLDTRHVEQ
jgi:biopolymer transport protein ExbD